MRRSSWLALGIANPGLMPLAIRRMHDDDSRCSPPRRRERTVGDLIFWRRRRWAKGRCPFCNGKHWDEGVSLGISVTLICENLHCGARISTAMGGNSSKIVREPRR
jgi:hypothetical protein